jgi:hypothetical protein
MNADTKLKPKFGDVASHPNWEWVSDAPGQAAKNINGLCYTDEETEMVGQWFRQIVDRYGAENVVSGTPRHRSMTCAFALYRRKSS